MYSQTTIQRAIAQVAAKAVSEDPEIEDRTLLDAYINQVATSVTFSTDTLDLYTNETKTLSVTTDPANYNVIYSVSDPTVCSVSNSGVIKGLKQGTANVTATFGEHTDILAVTVSGTIIEDFSTYTNLNSWVANGSNGQTATKIIVEKDGNKYAKFSIKGGYGITFNIPVPTQVQKNTLYDITFDVWSDCSITNASNNAQITFWDAWAPCYNVSGMLTESNKSGTFSMQGKLNAEGRLSTFQIMCLTDGIAEFYIDNIKFAPTNMSREMVIVNTANTANVTKDSEGNYVLTATNTSKESWTDFSFYTDEMEDIASGTLVTVTLTYKFTKPANARAIFLEYFTTEKSDWNNITNLVVDASDWSTVTFTTFITRGTKTGTSAWSEIDGIEPAHVCASLIATGAVLTVKNVSVQVQTNA